MRRVELKTLRLGNFKGATAFTLDLDGDSAVVRGRNSSGKTTLADAYTWLLFEKDSAGRKEFDIKTLNSSGQAVSGVDHEVEGTLTVDGDEVNLRRVYAEKWTKKRGSAAAEFTGHETTHFVDGVPVTKSEYAARVAQIADEATWRLLSDPGAFQALHWTKRREVLLDVCGDVSDQDVIASDPALRDLPDILGKRTLDEHRKVVVARRAELNKELQALPVRIDEVTRGLPDAPEADEATLTGALAEAKAAHQAALEELAAAKAGGGDASSQRARLREVEDELTRLERDANQKVEAEERAARQKAVLAEAELGGVERAIRNLDEQLEDRREALERAQERVENLRSEWAQVNAQKVAAHTEDACAACGQPLPPERVEAAHRKAVEQLNARKARELERIAADGKTEAARVDKVKAEIQQDEEKRASLAAQLDTLRGKAEAAKKAAERPTRRVDVTSTKAYTALAGERDALVREIAAVASGDPQIVAELAARVESLAAAMPPLEADLAAIAQRSTGLARIEELRGKERDLAGEYEGLERQLFLMDEFMRAKVALLEERVAERFQLVRFRLFRQQVNGGLEECCDTTVNGVPFESVNHAGQIAAGLDIIRTLQAHHELQCPVWVDQAESIHDIPATGAQQIALVVTAGQSTLRVERTALEVAA